MLPTSCRGSFLRSLWNRIFGFEKYSGSLARQSHGPYRIQERALSTQYLSTCEERLQPPVLLDPPVFADPQENNPVDCALHRGVERPEFEVRVS